MSEAWQWTAILMILAMNAWMFFKAPRKPVDLERTTQPPGPATRLKLQPFGRKDKATPKVNDDSAAWRKENKLDLPERP